MATPTFRINNGTGWPPSQAFTDCINVALNDFAAAVDSSADVTFEMRYQDIGATASAQNAFEGKTPNFAYSDLLTLVSGWSSGNAVATAFRAAMPGTDPFAATFTAGYTRTAMWDALINNGTYAPNPPFTNSFILINSNAALSWNTTPYTRVSGKINLYEIFMHEFTEGCFNRLALSDAHLGSQLPVFGSYTSGGARTITDTGQHFFSWDGGSTIGFELNLGNSGQDYSDYRNTPKGNGYFVPTGADWSASFGAGAIYTGPGSAAQGLLYQDWQQCACLMRTTTFGMKLAGLPTIDNGGAAPTISGTPGGTLTANSGTWFGYGTITKGVWQWNSNGTPINGATASTLDSALYAGTDITLTEAATGPIGTNTATSSVVSIPAAEIKGRRFRMDIETGIKPALLLGGAAYVIRNPSLTRRGLLLPKGFKRK